MSDSATDDGAGMSSFSTLQIYITVALLTVVGFVGVVGNGLVIFVYAQKNDKQTATLFILVLAVLDFITCLTMIPFTILLEATLWRLGVDFLCKAYFVLNSTNTIFGSLLISAIAVDRYLCICHPFSRLMTVPRARGMVIVLVLIALILGCPPLAAVGVVTIEKANGSQHYCIDSAFVSNNATTPVQNLIMEIGHQTHSTTYLLCILCVTVLYVLIYLSVHRVRQKRQTLKGIRLKSVNSEKTTVGGSLREDGDEEGSGRRWRTMCRWKQRFRNRGASGKKVAQETQPPKEGGGEGEGGGGGGDEQMAEIEICDTSADERQPLQPPDYNACVAAAPVDEEKVDTGHRVSLSYDKETGEASKGSPPPYQPGNGAAYEASAGNQQQQPPEGASAGQGGRRISMRFIKDTQVFQNFRTAAMLFIVAIVYILTFLPASLMSYKLVSLNLPVFYLYYLNNAANPIIYSFMNQHFREDIRALLARMRRSATGGAGTRHHASGRTGPAVGRKMMTTVSMYGNH